MPSLAVVTCIKNEGEDLVEWLCFHRHIGVSHFVIYDNISDDATQRILQSVPFRDEIEVRVIKKDSPQKAAFRDALTRDRDSLDWVAFVDGDEYIVPLRNTSLLSRLAEFEYDGIDGFGVCWRVFGSGGHATRPDGLVTDSFTTRAPDTFKANRHVKSIVRIAKVQQMITQHYFRVEGAYVQGDGSEPRPEFNGVVKHVAYAHGFALHHYITKSRAQCLAKIARGRPRPGSSPTKFRPLSYFDENDRNEVEDRRAAEVIAPIRDDVLRLRDEIGRD